MKEKLYIFDKYDNLLAITDNYIKADFEETVEMPVSFLINYPASDSDAEYLVGGNQVAFRDLKGDFRLFTIREVDDRDGEATEKIVNCMPGIQELADVMVEERRPQDKTAEYVLGLILENARWQVGTVADLGKNSTSFYFKSAYECLGELTDIWGGEIVDRVEIKGNKIAGRYVDIVHRKGSDTGKRFEIDKDIKNITRTVLYYPKTALYGKGKSLQTENEGHTRKITFRDAEWSKKKGDPVDKPKGQEWVGDPDALESHGIPNHETGKMMHRFGLYEDSEEENPEKLLAKTWQAVQSEKEPKAQYEMDIITFYGIAGYEHEQVFLGDTGIARDKDIKPMILIEARIMSWKYDIGNPEDGSLVLGNILDLDPDDSDIDWVIDKVKDKEGNWDAGGGPITDKKFPNIKPDVPKNFKAEGLFKTVMLSWTFESTYAIAAYEVFASQTNGFAPDPTNLVFRGKVGGYNFDADTDEKWYFRVRAVNTHGTASEYSEQVSASTVQLDLPDIEDIVPDFIEYSIYKGEEAPNPKDYKYWLDTSKEPNILRHWNGEDWKPLAPTSADELGAVAIADYQEKVSQIVSDLADKVGAEWVNGQLVKKADKEIVDEVKADLAEKVGAEWVNGQLVSKANKDDVYTIEQLDTRFNNVVSKTTYETDKDGIVKDLKSHETRLSQTETEIASKASKTEYNALKNRVNTAETSITQNAEEIKSKAELETVNVLTGRVESAESSITQNAKEIASKVSSEQYKTDKEGIIKNLESHESRIIQTEKDITAKVDNKQYKQDKNTLETSINKNSAAIQINAEGIASKVDNTTYNTDKQGIITDINSNKSSIEQHADMIRSKVDATYVKGELGKIEVGGRNLIINSNQSYKTVKAGIWYYHIQTRDLEEMGLKPGDEITLSFTAKLPKDAPGDIRPRFTWFYPDGRAHESNSGDKRIYPGEEKRLTHTATIPKDCYKLNFAVQRSDAGSDASELLFEIKHEMAEKGNKATDWTLAPEDIEDKINNIQVGGRNLLKDSEKIIDIERFYQVPIYNDIDEETVGEKVVFSFDLKINNNGFLRDISVYPYQGSGLTISDSTKVKPKEKDQWQRFSLYTSIRKAPVPEGYTKGGIGFYDYAGDNDYSIKNLKLEKGNKATDWTPAPEDFDAKIDDINVGGRNLLLNSKKRTVSPRNTGESSDNFNYALFVLADDKVTKEGETYTFSARVEITHGTFDQVRVYEYRPNGGTYRNVTIGEDGYISTTFTAKGSKENILVYAGIAGLTRGNGMIVHEAKLEKGNKATDWTPAPEDTDRKIESVEHYASEIEQTAKGVEQNFSAIKTDYEKFKSTANSTFKQQADQIASRVTKKEYDVDINGLRVKVSNAESSIKQNADEIISKVSKNGVVSSINQSPEQIKINAQRVSIDGDLVVKNGKVYIKDGVITNDLIASNAKIDFAKIANVRVTNAMISSLSADKISSGIIDANKVLIRVKNGTQAIQIDDKGFESVDSRGRVRIHIGVRDIAGKGQSDPSTIRFFSGNGSDAASVGMNVNNDFIIGSQNDDVSTSLYSGKRMLYKADAHRFWFNQGPSSNYWEFNDYKDGDGDWHPRIYSNRTAGGYVGIKSRRLWRVYSYYVHCNDLIEYSTREMKENINDFTLKEAQNIFDQIKVKSYHYKSDDKRSTILRKSYSPIAEESPKEILNEEGDAIVQKNYINVIAGALKFQTGRIDSLVSEIEVLKQEIKQLKGES